MQNLRTLLRFFAVINTHVNALQNRAVAHCIASKMKSASCMSSTDFQDVADDLADVMAHATPDDFCETDMQRLAIIGRKLEQLNAVMQLVQNNLLNLHA